MLLTILSSAHGHPAGELADHVEETCGIPVSVESPSLTYHRGDPWEVPELVCDLDALVVQLQGVLDRSAGRCAWAAVRRGDRLQISPGEITGELCRPALTVLDTPLGLHGRDGVNRVMERATELGIVVKSRGPRQWQPPPEVLYASRTFRDVFDLATQSAGGQSWSWRSVPGPEVMDEDWRWTAPFVGKAAIVLIHRVKGPYTPRPDGPFRHASDSQDITEGSHGISPPTAPTTTPTDPATGSPRSP